jgi:hypothetical protein
MSRVLSIKLNECGSIFDFFTKVQNTISPNYRRMIYIKNKDKEEISSMDDPDNYIKNCLIMLERIHEDLKIDDEKLAEYEMYGSESDEESDDEYEYEEEEISDDEIIEMEVIFKRF